MAAYNWALGQVKAGMDARKKDPVHSSVRWNLYALRAEWNQVKGDTAPSERWGRLFVSFG